MKFHFLTGLPRSGSTLLASILSQNPRFHASIQSPVGQVVTDALHGMGPRNEAGSFFHGDQRERMLRGLVEGYYSDLEGEKAVVFDNNRRWTANISLMTRLYPDAFFLACVRDPRAIVDSFERLFQAHPTDLSVIYGGVSNTTAYSRTSELMKAGGVVSFALESLKSAFYGALRNRLLVIEYDNLARFPAAVLDDIYNVLGEEKFNHNFENIEAIAGSAAFDAEISTPGLHDLKSAVLYEPRNSILPPDILSALPLPFWRSNDPVTEGS